MGGVHSSNLMSDVNILIVGDRNTEKFKFSVKNRFDIKFIKPDAILKLHSIWLNNEDQSDPNILNIDNYLLPIFENFNICMSRINSNDPNYFHEDFSKQNLINLITENDGTVSDSLTTTSSCVITNEKSGKRYDMAKKWQIPIIHPLWISHSLKRKSTLDFDYYNIELISDPSKIGENSCLVWNELLRSKSKKKIVVDEQEEELIKKDSKIWNSIMLNKNTNQVHSKLLTDETSWDDTNVEDDYQLPVKLEVTKSNLHPTNKKIPLKKEKTPIVTSKLFQNLTFQIELFESSQKSTLTKVIESHSGKIIEKSPSFIIIPSDFPLENLPRPLQSRNEQLVTEWFIERCLHYKAIKLDQWGKPFYYSDLNVPEDLNLSITGFQGIELLHLTKLISLLKFTLFEVLTNERDFLILNIDLLRLEPEHHLFQRFPTLFTPKQESNKTATISSKKKIAFAKQRNIPIVTISYLFTIFQLKKISNINQRDWCVYCPKFANLKPKLQSLVELNNHNDVTNDNNQPLLSTKKLEKESSLPKLPSPIRNKRKENWGRLVGRASKSQLDSAEMEPATNQSPEDHQQEQSLSDDSIQKSTQISYGQSETNAKLLRLLNRENEDSKKKKYDSANNNEPARKRTRAGFKEMLDVLDHN